MTYGAESFDKNIPNVQPPFEREHLEERHQCVTDIVEIKPPRIGPKIFPSLLENILYDRLGSFKIYKPTRHAAPV